MMISGLFNNALEIATLCCSPPESSYGYLFNNIHQVLLFSRTSEILEFIFIESFHSVALKNKFKIFFYCFVW